MILSVPWPGISTIESRGSDISSGGPSPVCSSMIVSVRSPGQSLPGVGADHEVRRPGLVARAVAVGLGVDRADLEPRVDRARRPGRPGRRAAAATASGAGTAGRLPPGDGRPPGRRRGSRGARARCGSAAAAERGAVAARTASKVGRTRVESAASAGLAGRRRRRARRRRTASRSPRRRPDPVPARTRVPRPPVMRATLPCWP